MPYELDYDNMVILDAEWLAEGGIGDAYTDLLPTLRRYVSQPANVEEVRPTTVRGSSKYRGEMVGGGAGRKGLPRERACKSRVRRGGTCERPGMPLRISVGDG